MNSTHASNLFSVEEKWTNIQNRKNMNTIFHDHPQMEQLTLQFSKHPPMFIHLSSFFLFLCPLWGLSEKDNKSRQPATTNTLLPTSKGSPFSSKVRQCLGTKLEEWLVFVFFFLFPYIIDGWMAMAWWFLAKIPEQVVGQIGIHRVGWNDLGSNMDSFYAFQIIFTNTKRCKNTCPCGDIISRKSSYQYQTV